MQTEWSRWRANLIYLCFFFFSLGWALLNQLICSPFIELLYLQVWSVQLWGPNERDTMKSERGVTEREMLRKLERGGVQKERVEGKVKDWMTDKGRKSYTERSHVPVCTSMMERKSERWERYAMMVLFLWQRSVAGWMCFICSGAALPG